MGRSTKISFRSANSHSFRGSKRDHPDVASGTKCWDTKTDFRFGNRRHSTRQVKMRRLVRFATCTQIISSVKFFSRGLGSAFLFDAKPLGTLRAQSEQPCCTARSSYGSIVPRGLASDTQGSISESKLFPPATERLQREICRSSWTMSSVDSTDRRTVTTFSPAAHRPIVADFHLLIVPNKALFPNNG